MHTQTDISPRPTEVWNAERDALKKRDLFGMPVFEESERQREKTRVREGVRER